jgi:hypothetical protein
VNTTSARAAARVPSTGASEVAHREPGEHAIGERRGGREPGQGRAVPVQDVTMWQEHGGIIRWADRRGQRRPDRRLKLDGRPALAAAPRVRAQSARRSPSARREPRA